MNDRIRQSLPVVLLILVGLVVLWRFVLVGDGDERGLASSDPEKRLMAVETLWHQDSAAARRRIRSLTDDPDRRVVLQSIRGMGFNRDEDNRRQLEELARPGGDPELRSEALAALGNYQEADPARFTSVLARDKDAQARAAAAKALARRADKSTMPAIYRALTDPDPQVRIWAITAIKNITFTTFLYDANQPPQTQRKVIEQIGEYLRKNGFM